MTFRIGYIYDPNPIPDNTLTPFLQAFMEQGVTVGIGTQLCGWDVNLGYVPSNREPTRRKGASALLGGDFSNSDQRAAVDAIVLDLNQEVLNEKTAQTPIGYSAA